MQSPLIAIVAPPECSSAHTLVERLRAAWPLASAPDIRRVAPADLTEVHESAAAIVFSGNLDRSERVRVADALAAHERPFITLTDPGATAETYADGVHAPADSDPRTLAGMIVALLARQPEIDALNARLRVADRLHHGVAAEVDRLTGELLLASRVQSEFLPKTLPELPDFATRVVFRPADFVSGDFYDVRRLDDRRVGFFIADAMGHGAPAALMTLFLAGNVQMTEPAPGGGERDVPPGEILRRLNAAMFACRGGASRIASAVCGVIDLEHNSVKLASAGHPRPIVIDADGEPKEIDADGILLGVIEDADFTDACAEFAPGDVLLLYSDGCEAALRATPSANRAPNSPARAMFSCFLNGEHARTPERRLEACFQAFEQRVADVAGSLHQEDDITLLSFARAARPAAGAEAA